MKHQNDLKKNVKEQDVYKSKNLNTNALSNCDNMVHSIDNNTTIDIHSIRINPTPTHDNHETSSNNLTSHANSKRMRLDHEKSQMMARVVKSILKSNGGTEFIHNYLLFLSKCGGYAHSMLLYAVFIILYNLLVIGIQIYTLSFTNDDCPFLNFYILIVQILCLCLFVLAKYFILSDTFLSHITKQLSIATIYKSINHVYNKHKQQFSQSIYHNRDRKSTFYDDIDSININDSINSSRLVNDDNGISRHHKESADVDHDHEYVYGYNQLRSKTATSDMDTSSRMSFISAVARSAIAGGSTVGRSTNVSSLVGHRYRSNRNQNNTSLVLVDDNVDVDDDDWFGREIRNYMHKQCKMDYKTGLFYCFVAIVACYVSGWCIILYLFKHDIGKAKLEVRMWLTTDLLDFVRYIPVIIVIFIISIYLKTFDVNLQWFRGEFNYNIQRRFDKNINIIDEKANINSHVSIYSHNEINYLEFKSKLEELLHPYRIASQKLLPFLSIYLILNVAAFLIFLISIVVNASNMNDNNHHAHSTTSTDSYNDNDGNKSDSGGKQFLIETQCWNEIGYSYIHYICEFFASFIGWFYLSYLMTKNHNSLRSLQRDFKQKVIIVADNNNNINVGHVDQCLIENYLDCLVDASPFAIGYVQPSFAKLMLIIYVIFGVLGLDLFEYLVTNKL